MRGKDFFISSLHRIDERMADLDALAALQPSEVLSKGEAIVAAHRLTDVMFDLAAIRRALLGVMADARYTPIQLSVVLMRALGSLEMEARAQTAMAVVNHFAPGQRHRLGVMAWRALRKACDVAEPALVEHVLQAIDAELARRSAAVAQIGSVRLVCEHASERMTKLAKDRVREMMADAALARTLEGFTVVVLPSSECQDKDVLAEYLGVDRASVLVLPEERLANAEREPRLKALAQRVVGLVSTLRPWPRMA